MTRGHRFWHFSLAAEVSIMGQRKITGRCEINSNARWSAFALLGNCKYCQSALPAGSQTFNPHQFCWMPVSCYLNPGCSDISWIPPPPLLCCMTFPRQKRVRVDKEYSNIQLNVLFSKNKKHQIHLNVLDGDLELIHYNAVCLGLHRAVFIKVGPSYNETKWKVDVLKVPLHIADVFSSNIDNYLPFCKCNMHF